MWYNALYFTFFIEMLTIVKSSEKKLLKYVQRPYLLEFLQKSDVSDVVTLFELKFYLKFPSSPLKASCNNSVVQLDIEPLKTAKQGLLHISVLMKNMSLSKGYRTRTEMFVKTESASMIISSLLSIIYDLK